MILTDIIMKTLPETILAYAHASSEGQILSPKELLHMGNRTAIDQALSRLARSKLLIRVGRGAYVLPTRGLNCCEQAFIDKVITSYTAHSGELIAPDGAACAATLGLGTQGQISYGYVTSGRSRTLQLGKVELALQHAPAWMLTHGSSPTGTAVRAMAWMGPDMADEALAVIRKSLSVSDWQAFVTCRALLPSWMARAIGASTEGNISGRSAKRLSSVVVRGESHVTSL